MIKVIVQCMFMIEMAVGSSPHLWIVEKEKDLEIDIIIVNNENYEGIHGDYKNFTFFSNDTIQEIECRDKEWRRLLIEKQNLVIIKPMIINTTMYAKMQNRVFQETVASILIHKDREMENKFICIQIMITLLSLIVLSVYIYYQKQRVYIQR